MQWFNGQNRELAIDYEHQTLTPFNRRADGLAPAAGWIGKLQVRGDGLWAADVKWTDQARTLIARGEYRYPSPVIYWSDEQYSELTGLGPVGLTNGPALEGAPLLAAARCGLDLAHFCRLMPDHPICTTTGETNMMSSVLKGPARITNDDGESGESAIAAIVEACREALSELMDALGSAGMTSRGAIADELSDEDYELFDAVSDAVWKLREMTTTAAGSRGGIPGADDAVLVARARREFAASAQLQREFGSVETFIAYKRAEFAGLVRIVGTHGTKQTAPARPSTAGMSPGLTETELARVYRSSVALQREFGELETFIAFKKHEQAGHVQIFRKQM